MRLKWLAPAAAAIGFAVLILMLLWHQSGIDVTPSGVKAKGRTLADALPAESKSESGSTPQERVAAMVGTEGEGRVLSGLLRIVDESLAPIAGAQIYQDPTVIEWSGAFDVGAAVRSLETPVATSGLDGTVSLNEVRGGKSILVTARGFLPTWLDGSLSGYQLAGTCIEMRKGGRLALRAIDRQGLPVQRFYVFMETQASMPYPSTAPRQSFFHILSAEGLQVVDLDCLPARETVALLVVSPGYLPERTQVSSQKAAATVVLSSAASISGYVKGGTGIEGLVVRAIATSGDSEPSRWLEAPVDGRQQFALDGAIGGNAYAVRLMRQASGKIVPAGSVLQVRGGDSGVELRADDDLVVIVRVVDADTHEHVGGVRLRATSLNDPDSAALGMIPEELASGELCMRGMLRPAGAGVFQIIATAPGYRAASATVDPQGAQPITAGIIAMKKVGTLRVKIANRTGGAGIGGARILLFSKDVADAQKTGNYVSATSGSDGVAVVEQVTLPAMVAVSASGFQSGQITLADYPKDLQVELDRAGRVVVRGEDPAGVSVRGVAFEYRELGGRWREGWLDGSGSSALSNLGLGDYEFRPAHGRRFRGVGPVAWSTVLPDEPVADEVRATITGEAQVVVVRYSPLTVVNVHISGRDGPVPGGEVLLVPGAHDDVAVESWLATSVLRRRADELGVAMFGRLPEGQYTLVCVQTGVFGGCREVISVRASQEVYQAKFNATAVAGRVVDGRGGPIANAAVYLEEAEARWVGPPAYIGNDGHGMPLLHNGLAPRLVGRTGKEGQFAFRVAGPQNIYRIAVEAPRHMRGILVMDVGTPVVIILDDAGELRVEVPHELLPCVIEAKPVSIQAEARRLSVPSDGVLELPGLKPGTWAITRYTDVGGRGTSVDIAVPSGGVTTVRMGQ